MIPHSIVALAIGNTDRRTEVESVLRSHGAQARLVSDLSGIPETLCGARILVVEEEGPTEASCARVLSLTGALRDVLVISLVEEGRRNQQFFAAGAFDVIEYGPELDLGVARMLATARRFLQLQTEHSRLVNDLAHQDRVSALGLLAAGVSHEVNSPAAALLANLENMREQLESTLALPRHLQSDALNGFAADWLESLGDCLGASRRIVSIVRSLNVFSHKAEESSPELVDINEEVLSVMRLIGKEVHFQSHLVLKLDTELPMVSAVANHVTQVVTNLIMNGLQALENKPREDRQLTLSTSFDADNVMVEVTDNGPGIAPEDVGRVFDPFFTTEDVGTSSGLGLSIAHQLIQKAGGDILVESSLGCGATFRIVFQRVEQNSVPSAREKRMPPAHDRLRVLVVDDDELLLRSLARFLSRQFEVITSSSVQEALDLLRGDDRIDVVLSDIIMRNASGVDFYDQVEQKHPHLARRTIFMSGGVRAPEVRARIDRTGRPFVSKPVETQELTKLIRSVGRARGS